MGQQGVQALTMRSDPQPEILTAEQLGNSVLVRFQNGKTAIYPANLLYAAIGLSEVMNEATLEDENG